MSGCDLQYEPNDFPELNTMRAVVALSELAGNIMQCLNSLARGRPGRETPRSHHVLLERICPCSSILIVINVNFKNTFLHDIFFLVLAQFGLSQLIIV